MNYNMTTQKVKLNNNFDIIEYKEFFNNDLVVYQLFDINGNVIYEERDIGDRIEFHDGETYTIFPYLGTIWRNQAKIKQNKQFK